MAQVRNAKSFEIKQRNLLVPATETYYHHEVRFSWTMSASHCRAFSGNCNEYDADIPAPCSVSTCRSCWGFQASKPCTLLGWSIWWTPRR
jgi:hypothetical protein